MIKERTNKSWDLERFGTGNTVIIDTQEEDQEEIVKVVTAVRNQRTFLGQKEMASSIGQF